jgi:hypothetical protein
MNHRPTSSRRLQNLSLGFLSLLLFLFSACTGQITEPSESSEGDSMTTPDAGTPTDPGASADAATSPPSAQPPGEQVSLSFTESGELVQNPERGFYVGLDLLNAGGAAQVRANGHTLAIALVGLDDYRDSDLDAAFLTRLGQGFAAARAAGIKVVLRFSYNSSFAADASKARILGHIAQLKPLLQDNADVISVMQAGFIGAWGEWHSSTNGLDNDADRGAILNAILDALPASRAVQVRTPMYKAGIFGASALTDADAFDGSHRARVGHHNDCFLASDSDFGTYASPIATWESFTAADSKYTPMGGETCAISARTDCSVALAEMEQNHWSYLNQEYHQDVIAGWESQGCADEIRRRLGYRLSLSKVVHDAKVAPGGVLTLALEIKNSGYSAPYNARPVFVVLDGGGDRRVVQLTSVDVRRWQPGQVSKVNVKLRVPADAAAGSYKLALWLPDDAPALRNDARFSVRLANASVWDATAGQNVMSERLTIDPAAPAAPGSIDATASQLAVLP